MHPSMNHPRPYELCLQLLLDSTISVANKNSVCQNGPIWFKHTYQVIILWVLKVKNLPQAFFAMHLMIGPMALVGKSQHVVLDTLADTTSSKVADMTSDKSQHVGNTTSLAKKTHQNMTYQAKQQVTSLNFMWPHWNKLDKLNTNWLNLSRFFVFELKEGF